MPRPTRLYWIAALVLLVGVGSGIYLNRSKSDKGPAEGSPSAAAQPASGAASGAAGPVSVTLVRADKRDVPVELAATATVTAIATLEVKAQVASTIAC